MCNQCGEAQTKNCKDAESKEGEIKHNADKTKQNADTVSTPETETFKTSSLKNVSEDCQGSLHNANAGQFVQDIRTVPGIRRVFARSARAAALGAPSSVNA